MVIAAIMLNREMFRYHNMDQARASGIDAAEKIIKRNTGLRADSKKACVFAGANA